MTNQEAIDIIKNAIAQVEWDYPMDYAAAFDMALKALENGWISVKDRLPESIINKVLVWLEHDDLIGYIGFGHYEKYKGQEIWFDLEHSEAFSVRGYTVTHWMPLPEPPKEE